MHGDDLDQLIYSCVVFLSENRWLDSCSITTSMTLDSPILRNQLQVLSQPTSSICLVLPFSFQRNHIKPFIFTRTQQNSRLVVMILLNFRGLWHSNVATFFNSMVGCGGSYRIFPYRVQYQMLLNHPPNDFSCYFIRFTSFGLNDRVRIAQFNWCVSLQHVAEILYHPLIFIDFLRSLCLRQC